MNLELVGAIKNYDWGKVGIQSLVGQLVVANENNQSIFADVPYAELWMGDHVNGPAWLKLSKFPLNLVLDTKLTYLFKVLSVRKALSIQVHPNKTQAEQLHKDRPEIYKDPNHKPEMAIALTPFTALCGFRPYTEILNFCEELPPLKSLLGGSDAVEQLSSNDPNALRPLYRRLMTADSKTIFKVIEEICTDFMRVLLKYDINEIFDNLCNDYPGDVGILSIFFLNIIKLQPGECLYLPPNEIHAYIEGDCVECMACSDNVIRAGLTSKYKDVEQLLDIVDYTGQPAHSKYFHSYPMNDYFHLFIPPVNDFLLIEIEIPFSVVKDYSLSIPTYPSILLVLEGVRTLRLHMQPDIVVKRGSIIYLPKSTLRDMRLINEQKPVERFLAYIATKNMLARSVQ